ncbi:response regulator [Paenibacillus sp. HB172176]|uniref:response regulator transcription factor n=1 Tax=Paenibacillus sp. HB172176 TaxID=2493690 RepID=UPI00143C9D34|nr:response regulator [Paenibacillus sp. HB172176]
MHTLIIIDDEEEIRNGLSRFFPWHELGYEVVRTFDNGKAALDYLLTHPVDVALCDIRMPIMTGIELAERLHREKSETALLFLTGHKDFEYAKQAIIFNVNNYIVKPTKYEELYAIFSSLKLELDEKKGGSERKIESDHGSVIRAVKLFVNQHYQDVTLEKAANHVHLNPYYLSSYFKEKTGENFSDYVLRAKMRKAVELLADIRYKTYEVSEMVGYSNAKNFTRTFKKFYGVTPREYKQSGAPSE